MYEFFKGSEFFNFELTRILSTSPFGGCDIAEFLDAVGAIKKHDAQSWQDAWHAQAVKAEQRGQEAAAAGHRILARDTFLRATNYFRASQYMMFDDSASLQVLERSVQNFERAMKIGQIPVEHLEIPYQGHKLPGFLFLPEPENRLAGKTPVLVCTGGADSTKEELYFLLGASGPALGYAVLIFDGPGQGISILRDQTVQRSDWEIVIKAVLDYTVSFASSHSDLRLDTQRIAITGASMGGYYALRGAADPRIKACVSIDAFYDLWDLVLDRMPKSLMNAWTAGWIPDGFVDAMTALQGRFQFQSRWEITTMIKMLGIERPTQLLRRMRTFTFRLAGDDGKQPDYLHAITCPVLVSGAAHSLYFKPELAAGKIMQCLKNVDEGNKELWIAKEPADGGLQAKVGAWRVMQQRMFVFLDRHFEIEREKLSVE
ncbi:alpha/beta hydrolase [Massariosphaeria phaeospora]|uniref:Alpha/beta hydrolase n=1 Tax=Massariosphaeria phaeospora TaxID=100035 RepID=A0A7C8MET1_9PLEO|nr:alpha/beta hydrolase [Massariosphaeria phaeospora]